MLDKPVPIMIYTPHWADFRVCLVGIPLATFVCCRDGLFNRFLLESLILAQDERWRRA